MTCCVQLLPPTHIAHTKQHKDPAYLPTNTHKQTKQYNLTKRMRLLPLIVLTALPAVSTGAFFKKKHRRQKAGTRHEDHDAVHVVVNKVG